MTSTKPKKSRKEKLDNPRYRQAYLAARVRNMLAARFRQLRGDMTQKQFGELIGKPQSVVSRLEDPSYGQVTLQTLLEVATALDMGIILDIVDVETALEFGDRQLESLGDTHEDAE